MKSGGRRPVRLLPAAPPRVCSGRQFPLRSVRMQSGGRRLVRLLPAAPPCVCSGRQFPLRGVRITTTARLEITSLAALKDCSLSYSLRQELLSLITLLRSPYIPPGYRSRAPHSSWGCTLWLPPVHTLPPSRKCPHPQSGSRQPSDRWYIQDHNN